MPKYLVEGKVFIVEQVEIEADNEERACDAAVQEIQELNPEGIVEHILVADEVDDS